MILPGGASVELVAENPAAATPVIYRPRVEQKYLRAEYDRNLDTWKAVDAAGMVYTFGDPAANMGDHARLKSDGEGPCSFTTAWGLTRSKDANGNTIDTTWVDTATNGNQLVPEEINYGGNETTSLAHFHSVEFIWTSNVRPMTDVYDAEPGPVSYRRGVRERMETRLVEVEVHSDMAPIVNPSKPTLVREYDLMAIDPGRANLRIGTVDADDFPEQSFVYSEWSADKHAAVPVEVPEPSGNTNVRTNKIRYWEDSSQDVERTMMDMNGDGLLDLVDAPWTALPQSPQSATWNVYLGTVDGGGGFGFEQTAAPWTRVAGSNEYYLIRNVFVSGCNDDMCTKYDTFDIDGDTIPDYVIAENDGTWRVHKGQWSATPAPGSGYFDSTVTDWAAPTEYIRFSTKGPNSKTLYDVVDMNGDGLVDLVLPNLDPGSWRVHLNNGDGFDQNYVSLSVPDAKYDAISRSEGFSTDFALLDFNGDGLPDLIDDYEVGTPPGLTPDPCLESLEFDNIGATVIHYCGYVFFNNGQGFSSDPQLIRIPVTRRLLSSQDPDQATNYDLLDINGDGLPDWVYNDFNDDQWYVLLNIGGELERLDYQEEPTQGNPSRMTQVGYADRLWSGIGGPIRDVDAFATVIDMLDLNGDGFLDRVVSGAGTSGDDWEVYLNQQGTKPTLLDMMHNGLGGANTIKYEPSSHQLDEEGNGPGLPFITWVVTGTRLNDGLCVPDPGVDVFGPENDCIDEGHELITATKYEDGLFAYELDPGGGMPIREFRGFGTVTQTDLFGNETATVFEQGTNKKGLVASVIYFADEADLASIVRLETNEWEEIPFPGSSHRTQMWLSSNQRQNLDMGPAGEAHDITRYNAPPDLYGNITKTWTVGNLLPYPVYSETEFIAPIPGTDGPSDKPQHTWTWDEHDGSVDGSGSSSTAELLEEKRFFYDYLAYGSVLKGNLTTVESRLIDDSGDTWVETETEYDAYGNITKVIDAEGRETTTDYTADGKDAHLYPIRVTDAIGHVTTQYFDYRHGKPSNVFGPNGIATQVIYLYDTAGRIKSEIHPGDTVGAPTVSYDYDFPSVTPGTVAPHSVAEVIRKQDGFANGRWTRTYFDALGRQRYREIPRVFNGGMNTSVVRADQVKFDRGGNIKERRLPYLDGGNNSGWITYTYHLNGNGSITDPLGRVRSTKGANKQTTVTSYLGEKTVTFDQEGDKTESYTDAMGRGVGSEVYRLESGGSFALYSTSESVYDGLGRLLEVYQNREDADIPMKEMRYDTLGRKIETVDRDSGVWTYGYDKVGNLIWQDDPKADQHVQICYDKIDRPTRKCSTIVDKPGVPYLICAPFACNGDMETVYEYDDPAVSYSDGRLTKVIDNAGEMRVTGYDARGRQEGMVRMIDAGIPGEPAGEAHYSYVYNTTNEVVETTYPDGEVVQVTYDESGQPVNLSNTDGYFYAQNAQYNLFGRLTRLEKGNNTTDTVEYYWGNSGDPLRNHQPKRISVAKTTTSGTTTLHKQYYDGFNKRGQITKIKDEKNQGTHAASNGAVYGYDFLGRLNSFNPDATGAPTLAYDYNKWGNITVKGGLTLSYGDPTLPGTNPHQTISASKGGGTSSTGHDANGNRTTLVNVGAQAQYDGALNYDSQDRLSEVNMGDGTDVFFYYDDGGQQKAKATYDGMGVLTGLSKYYAPSIEVRPDGKTMKSYFFGGQRVATRIVSDSSWQTTPLASLQWRSPIEVAMQWAERPVLIVSLTQTAQTAVLTSMGVLFVALFLMPASRRRRAVVGVRLGRAPALLLAILFATGTLPWPMLIQPAEAQCQGCECPTPTPGPGEELRYFHYDHQGSPVMITDENGTATEHIRYNPYGEVRARFDTAKLPIPEPGPGDIRYEYTGYEAERTTGLLYANARFYDPMLGSFTSHDPAAEFWSPYTYVGWDPVNGTDPTGACELLCLAIIGFAIGFAASAINAAINGASFGEALKAGLIGGAIGAITAPIGGYIVKEALGPLLNGVAGAVGATGEGLAKGILFVGGLGQSAYNATEGNYTGLISIGLSIAVSGFLPKGADASEAADGPAKQLLPGSGSNGDVKNGAQVDLRSSLDGSSQPSPAGSIGAPSGGSDSLIPPGKLRRIFAAAVLANGLEHAAANNPNDFWARLMLGAAGVLRLAGGTEAVFLGYSLLRSSLVANNSGFGRVGAGILAVAGASLVAYGSVEMVRGGVNLYIATDGSRPLAELHSP